MGLMKRLAAGPVGLDTVIFIYYIEQNREYMSLLDPLFAAIDAGEIQAFTSTVTLLEVLAGPYRAADAGLAEQYENLLTRSRGLTLLDLDRPILRAAAQIRAATSAKTPDALQLAAALAGGCRVFLTNDRDLPSLPSLTVIQLSECG